MSNPLHTNELETFLQKQVSNHRMYPADKIWRNIQKEIHGEGRWPALTFVSIFIITALVVSTLMVKPEDRLHKNTIVYPAQKEEIGFEKTKLNTKDAVAAAPVQYSYTEKITQQTLQQVSEAIIARNEKQNTLQPVSITNESLFSVQDKSTQNINADILAAAKTSAKQETVQHIADAAKDDKATDINLQYNIAKPASHYFNAFALLNVDALKKPAFDLSSIYNSDDVWRNFPLLNAHDVLRKKLSHLSFQFYLTPSVSYRELNDANGKTAHSYAAVSRASNYQLDINQAIKHLPALGAEVGFALGYKLTDALTLKGGLQFNMRQYGIKAYGTQKSNAALSARTTDNILNSALPDNTNDAYASSVNVASASSEQQILLYNRYYEIAAPVGVDWRIFSSGNGRLTLNAAVSAQPTYTFDKQPFAVSVDHKGYADGTSIMRNWNLNSNAEAYVSYKMGAFRWQIGPQFRYQHFSTYSNSYPTREHLLDYGVKIGFTKSLD